MSGEYGDLDTSFNTYMEARFTKGETDGYIPLGDGQCVQIHEDVSKRQIPESALKIPPAPDGRAGTGGQYRGCLFLLTHLENIKCKRIGLICRP